MFSIYHFFAHLIRNKSTFAQVEKLEDFPFDTDLLSSLNRGKFPDLSVKVNEDRTVFSGGELIELKDSKSYGVSSFNSTIPTGKKDISKLTEGTSNIVRHQMEQAGDDIFSLPIRDVFYLVRGRSRLHTKVCLVHGSFFETVEVAGLIQKAFAQVLDEALGDKETQITEDLKDVLAKVFSQQESFSKLRHIDRASVKLRFRIMTEVEPEGNILNAAFYPEIAHDTLNLIVPLHNPDDEGSTIERLRIAASDIYNQIKILKIKHPFNGWFIVFQTSLTD